MTAARRPTPRLAGAAEEALAELRSGVGRLLLIAGPAGAGKTRLAHAIDAAARGCGAHVAWAVCGRAGAPAFWPWVQAARTLPLPPEVLAAHPNARRLLGAAAVPGPTDGRARFEFFDDVAGLLRGAAQLGATVIVFDDLHDADAASLLLLQHVVASLRGMPLLVVATVRTDVEPDRPEWPTVWPELLRYGDVVVVGPLRAAEIAELLTNATGAAPPALVQRIAARTGGNALFVCELVRLCAVTGGDVDALPDTVRAVIAARVAERSANCRRLLSLVAVTGTSAALALVAALLGEGIDDVLTAEDEAVRHGLLERPDPGRLAFVHEIVRDAVYDAVPAAHRMHWHRSIAERLALSGAAADAAYHYRLAGPESQPAAAEWFARAGQESMALLAYEDAATQFGAALDCGPADPGRVQVQLGAALLAIGDAAGARAAHLAAVAAGRRAGDAHLVAAGALGLGAGQAGFEIALLDREQIAALEDALALLGTDAPATRAAVLAHLSIALTFSADVERRITLATKAVELARATDDEWTIAVALASHADAIAGPQHCERRLATASDIVDIAGRLRDSSLELLGRRHRIVARLELGDLAGAEDDLAAYRSVATALRQPLYSWYVPLWSAALALARGDLRAADVQLTDAARIGAQAGSINAAALVPSQRFARAGELHDQDILGEMLTDPGLTEQTGPWVPIAVAHVQAAIGDHEAARAGLDVIADRIAALPLDSEWLPTIAQAVEAVTAVGGHPLARPLYEMLLPYGNRYVVEGIGAALRGSAQRHLGMLATVLGDRAAAAKHFDAALTANRRIGARLLVACTLRDAGTLLDNADQLREAERMWADMGVTSKPPASSGQNGFRRDGETWTLTYAGTSATLRDSKGLRDLAVLLATPGRAVPAVDLATPRAAVPRRGDAELHEPGDLGELLDERARRAYRARLRDLEDEAAEADAGCDIERSARIAAERDAIVAELGAAYGLAGRPRRTGSPVERARSTVTARIRDSIRRIEAVHPQLGRHFGAAVRTGTLCSYEPEHPVAWQVTS